MAMKIIDYVAEEVRRQGHDTATLDGVERVSWMLNAWAYALTYYTVKPHVKAAIYIGTCVEPRKNTFGLRTCAVCVGPQLCPDWREVPDRLDRLFSYRDSITPMEFYKEFELIHPFVDGNGRAGKVLLNWLNGSLLDPIFPPADLFGAPIRNP